jgi:hypothetical protein
MIKSKKSENSSVKSDYPMVMEWLNEFSQLDRNFFVLMCKDGVGTVIYAEDSCDHSVGDHSDDWEMDSFVPYTGEVTLSNE